MTVKGKKRQWKGVDEREGRYGGKGRIGGKRRCGRKGRGGEKGKIQKEREEEKGEGGKGEV